MFKSRKRKYFEAMLKDAEEVIWQKELTKFTLLTERESLRRHYDRLHEALQSAQERLKLVEKDEKKAVEKSIQELQASVESTAKELDVYNTKVDGGPPSAEVPEGSIGITNDLQKWAERKELIKQFIKLNT